MSQLLGRIGKLSSLFSVVKKQRLCLSEFRSLSTAAAATPYLLFNETNHRRARTPSGGEAVVDMNLYDPRKDERVKIPDQTLPEELYASVKIGSSRGWVGVQNVHDSTLRLTNIFNPCASVSSRKVISLPPWDDQSRGQAVSSISLSDKQGCVVAAKSPRSLVRKDRKDHIDSISLSASPDHKDCVVAAKSFSPFISLCRPGDSEWTRITVPFYASKVTYSVRDGRFYLYCGKKEEYEGPIDLIKASSGFPQVSIYQSFPNSDIPESRQDQVNSTMKTQYLVESPSGDFFIVYWCDDFLTREEMESIRSRNPAHRTSFRRMPRAFVVFRQDHEQRIGSYTEDIGDLCIFLGKSEAFCVSATEYPGLNPNSVYYASYDKGFGFYDLSTNTLHDVIDPLPPFSSVCRWLAPLLSND